MQCAGFDVKRLLPNCARMAESTFDNALKRAKIELPSGQKSHVLRHTFASHLIINDGNILKLQNLGHTTLDMTMRSLICPPNT